jgi:hypothetical protein
MIRLNKIIFLTFFFIVVFPAVAFAVDLPIFCNDSGCQSAFFASDSGRCYVLDYSTNFIDIIGKFPDQASCFLDVGIDLQSVYFDADLLGDQLFVSPARSDNLKSIIDSVDRLLLWLLYNSAIFAPVVLLYAFIKRLFFAR